MKAKQVKQKLVKLGAWDEFKKEMRKNNRSIKEYFAFAEEKGKSFEFIIMGAILWPLARFDYWRKISQS